MSGALDTKARATALKLLQKFGKIATYRKVVTGAYNTSTQTVTNTTTDYAITTYLESPSQGLLSSGLAISTDLVALVSAQELGVDVVAADTIIMGSKTYTVKSNSPIYSGELIALHQIVIQAT